MNMGVLSVCLSSLKHGACPLHLNKTYNGQANRGPTTGKNPEKTENKVREPWCTFFMQSGNMAYSYSVKLGFDLG